MLDHIKRIEYVEEIGPYQRPMVMLYNKNKVSRDEALYYAEAQQYNPNMLIMTKQQWVELFCDGHEKIQGSSNGATTDTNA